MAQSEPQNLLLQAYNDYEPATTPTFQTRNHAENDSFFGCFLQVGPDLRSWRSFSWPEDGDSRGISIGYTPMMAATPAIADPGEPAQAFLSVPLVPNLCFGKPVKLPRARGTAHTTNNQITLHARRTSGTGPSPADLTKVPEKHPRIASLGKSVSSVSCQFLFSQSA